MNARRNLLARVHIAKKDLGLDDDVYRDFLEQHTGQTSAGGLSEIELKKLVKAFEGVGWTSQKKGSYRAKSKKAYVRLIHVYWKKLSDAEITRKDGLDAFVKSQVKVDSVEWLDKNQGNEIIEALKGWAKRMGVSLAR